MITRNEPYEDGHIPRHPNNAMGKMEGLNYRTELAKNGCVDTHPSTGKNPVTAIIHAVAQA